MFVDGASAEPWNATTFKERLDPPHCIEPASDRIVLGRFRRDGRKILVVLNAGKEAYRGKLAGGAKGDWLVMNPASGAIEEVMMDGSGQIELGLLCVGAF